METITISGTIFAANGMSLVMILYNSDNDPVWPSPLTLDSEFNQKFDLPNGPYTLSITGYTQGTFVLNITGIAAINPSVPATYINKISDSFNITI